MSDILFHNFDAAPALVARRLATDAGLPGREGSSGAVFRGKRAACREFAELEFDHDP